VLTLWDLIRPKRRASAPTVRPAPPSHRRAGRTASRARPAQDRYDRITEHMLAAYGVRVRKWRTSMSGIAWEVRYRDGTVRRLIEAPRPKGPMSAAVFLHEIGHHAIGFSTYRPRCLEEYHAWRFAIEQMEAHGLNITDGVRRRMRLSLRYAVDKARRRGLRELPSELREFSGTG